MIRNVYWDLYLSSETPATTSVESHSKKQPRSSHIAHCFDYLRQAIQCAGDMTIEWANLTDPNHQHIDGWGVPHRECRNWEFASPYLRENGVPERTAETHA
jgi:hypothetical protein